MATPFAFVTLVTSDSYSPGALALAAALRDVHTELNFQTVCLVTPETVDVSTIKLLRRAFNHVVGVQVITQQDEAALSLLGRPDLNTVLTKIHVFRLTQFKKIIFLDADVLPIRPLSHLFALPHDFAAVPDVGWPDIFNSGVMLLTPAQHKFDQLRDLLRTRGTWDGGDQGLLNEWRGDDWHRLSFTYNTTPTAAYTYAPAYQRFGSQISAIHFIGPNKPWAAIPYRPPHATAPQDTHAAYDYNALLDRWFDVYDRHYRTHPPAPQAEFAVQRYPSAWDEHPAHPPGPAGGALGLDDLKRIALQGMSAVAPLSDAPGGEGAYHSMPLDGRVHLMRPTTEEEPEPEAHAAPDPETRDRGSPDTPRPSVASGETTPRAPRPPTRRDDVPPSPQLWAVSLPDSTAISPIPRDYFQLHPGQQHVEVYYHQPEEQHFQAQQQPPDYQHPPVQQQHQHYHLPEQQQHQDNQQYHPPEQQHHYQDNQQHHQDNQQYHAPEQQQHHGDNQHYHAPEQQQRHEDDQQYRPQQQQQEPHHEGSQPPPEPPRPSSPPLLRWNPAVEPPPTDNPSSGAFPPDTYYPNIWDQPPSRSHDQTWQAPSHHPSWEQPHPTPDRAFFEPPPTGDIPASLIEQGHYRSVVGAGGGGAAPPPAPDPAKVRTVFPWEARRRHAPERAFPSTDAPPPGAFAAPSPPPPAPAPLPAGPQRVWGPPPPQRSPQHGLPARLAYANAWDAVPSIQKYASRLVGPHAPREQQPESPGRWRRSPEKNFRGFDDRASVGSRDGDVEDEGDDDDDDDDAGAPAAFKWIDEQEEEARDAGGRASPKMSRTPSLRSATSSSNTLRTGSLSPLSSPKAHAPARGGRYRSQGVQTLPKSTREFGVQAAAPATGGAPAAPPARLPSPGPEEQQQQQQRAPPALLTAAAKRLLDNAGAHALLPPAAIQEPTAKPTPASPALTTPAARTPAAFPPMELEADPSGARSPREFTYTPVHSPPRQAPAGTPLPPLPALVGNARKLSGETATTPASSVGPASPAEAGLLPPPRKAGRVFDPARGVELFKRGSEEVLARFLRMGSWEEDMANHASV